LNLGNSFDIETSSYKRENEKEDLVTESSWTMYLSHGA